MNQCQSCNQIKPTVLNLREPQNAQFTQFAAPHEAHLCLECITSRQANGAASGGLSNAPGFHEQNFR